jgi:hypothetical protein
MQYKSARERVLTFNNLIRKTSFAAIMDRILQKLEEGYGIPVDIEFVADIDEDDRIRINLLQCRPLTEMRDLEHVELPEHLDDRDIIFATDSCVNTAAVEGIAYIVYVDSDGYKELPRDLKISVGRAIGRINAQMEAAGQRYLLIGPGRWGSNNLDLGVPVSYADIDAAALMVEVAKASDGYVPEVSYGTHFFQDLVEDCIYYVAVYPGLAGNALNEEFLRTRPSDLNRFAPDYARLERIVRVVRIEPDEGCFRTVLDRDKNRALCYCARPRT